MKTSCLFLALAGLAGWSAPVTSFGYQTVAQSGGVFNLQISTGEAWLSTRNCCDGILYSQYRPIGSTLELSANRRLSGAGQSTDTWGKLCIGVDCYTQQNFGYAPYSIHINPVIAMPGEQEVAAQITLSALTARLTSNYFGDCPCRTLAFTDAVVLDVFARVTFGPEYADRRTDVVSIELNTTHMPEPSSAVLVLLPVAAMILQRRKRARA